MAENRKIEELSDDELDQVTGGGFFDFFSNMQRKLRGALNMNNGNMKNTPTEQETMMDKVTKEDRFI